MGKPDNPAAFPCAAIGPADDLLLQEGMSLRDWFAGQALAILPHVGETALFPAEWAHDAYAIADALLAEREKRS